MTSKTIVTIMTLTALTYNTAQASKLSPTQLLVIQDIAWAAKTTGVNRDVLLAVCFGEGSFRDDNSVLTHLDGQSLSYGTCQVKFSTARFMDKHFKHNYRVSRGELDAPHINAFYAALYLKYQLRRYHGDVEMAVDAYNKHNAIGTETPYVKKFRKNLKFVKAHAGQF